MITFLIRCLINNVFYREDDDNEKEAFRRWFHYVEE